MIHPLPHYPGSKGASGVAQRIVSLMPPHAVYIEGFAGGAAVYRLKRPARLSILLDLAPAVIRAWRPAASPGLWLDRLPTWVSMRWQPFAPDAEPRGSLVVAMVDVVKWMESTPAVLERPDTLLYLDPPYLRSVRTRLMYDVEMATAAEHRRFLRAVRALSCNVMVSHYPCRLYDEVLGDWRAVRFRAMTRGGVRLECVWCNFPEPPTLHDARFVGSGFRERERIKRKARRWQARFLRMSAGERQVVATELARIDRQVLVAALGEAR